MKTLKQLTGERPRCQHCDKELKPWTSSAWFKGSLEAPPALESVSEEMVPGGLSLARLRQLWYEPARVHRMKLLRHTQETEFSFWTGDYAGYG
jgi:hypothetical protein